MSLPVLPSHPAPLADTPAKTEGARRPRHDVRAAALRLAAAVVLVTNLMAGAMGGAAPAHMGAMAPHMGAALLYAAVAGGGLVVAVRGVSSAWLATAMVVVDAVLVVTLFHQHLFVPAEVFDHSLTASTLAVGFLLLAQVSLALRPGPVLLFSGLVLAGWLALLGAMSFFSMRTLGTSSHDWRILYLEFALAAAFGFAALVSYLLTRDHNALLAEAIENERRRGNLARFFSPDMVSRLQADPKTLAMARRQAAVMFVDLRGFTGLSEMQEPETLAKLLGEYRAIVTGKVFAHGGTVDKFIGDGVMAVFGHIRANGHDCERAVRCGLEIVDALRAWRADRARRGEPSPAAGVGLHFGEVYGGVLHSGCHDEFTVFGDAVNVAERLEKLCKPLGAAFVASEAVLAAATPLPPADWRWREATELAGRGATLKVAFVPLASESPAV